MSRKGLMGTKNTMKFNAICKDAKKCKHGKTFCCECEYGGHNERDFIETPIDAVEEMNRNHAR